MMAAPAGWRRWRGPVAWLIGVTLLGSALALIVSRHQELAVALSAIRAPSPLLAAALLGLVVAHVASTGLFFQLLMSRYGRVGALEIKSLMAGSMLLNYLPLRPGLFGRVAYHRAVNGIPAMDSARVVAQALLLSGAMAVLLTLVAAASLRQGLHPAWGLGLPAAAGGAAALVWRGQRVLLAAALLRLGEILLWALRYFVAFALIGSEITFAEALAFAAVGVVTTMVPLVSNGLGLREWAIGLLAPVLTGYALELGVTAELVSRLAEIVVIVPLGLLGLAGVARRAKSASRIDR